MKTALLPLIPMDQGVTSLIPMDQGVTSLIPMDQGVTSLIALLFNPDRELYGTAQLTGFAGILLTLYLANLSVEVVLYRRFQIAGMLALLAAWIGFINSSGSESHFLLLYLLALPFHLLGWLVFVRGIQAFGRQKG